MSVLRHTVHSIQFLRFVAATLVVLTHAHLGFAIHSSVMITERETYFFSFGAVGVHIFFVISGYIMYLTNIARPQPFVAGRFFARRLIRIFPAYWMFVAIYLATETALGIAPVLSPDQLVGALLLWPGYAPKVIGPAWTLSFELYFYFVFGLVMMLGAARGVWLLTGGFLLCVVAGALLHPTSPAMSLASNALLLEFVAGVWIARVTSTTALPRTAGWLAVGAALAGFAFSIAWGYDRLPSAVMWGAPSMLLVAGAVILEQTATAGWRATLVRRLSVLGDSSYTLYLCHILLVTIATQVLSTLGVIPPRVPAVVVTTLICIAAAHIFYLTIERRVVGRLHRLTERPAVKPSPRPDEAPSTG